MVWPMTSTKKRRSYGFLNRGVWTWAIWDWGSAAFNAVVTPFVFSTYITNPDLFGPDANALLGWALAVAGILVALTAPAIGQWTDRSGKRNTSLTIATLGVVVT